MSYNNLMKSLDTLELTKFQKQLYTYTELANNEKRFIEALEELKNIKFKFKDEKSINMSRQVSIIYPYFKTVRTMIQIFNHLRTNKKQLVLDL